MNPLKRKAKKYENVLILQKRMKLEKNDQSDSENEEDSLDEEERNNVMHEDDIEGEEEGTSNFESGTKFTPFNMKEELEEGHFDRDGHFQWDKNKEVRDNWLDNIDWCKIKSDKRTNSGLADSSSSEDESDEKFNEVETYKELLFQMKPGETVKKTLQRLGKNTTTLSSIERLKRKQDGALNENVEIVTKFTELANKILTKMGNMDIYEETYEIIDSKIKLIEMKKNKNLNEGNSSNKDELDMYADDFDEKEKSRLCSEKNNSNEISPSNDENSTEQSTQNQVLWEYKWKQEDKEIYGPFSTEQMLLWVYEEYFKNGVFVRKVGESTFYSSHRVDFELYL